MGGCNRRVSLIKPLRCGSLARVSCWYSPSLSASIGSSSARSLSTSSRWRANSYTILVRLVAVVSLLTWRSIGGQSTWIPMCLAWAATHLPAVMMSMASPISMLRSSSVGSRPFSGASKDAKISGTSTCSYRTNVQRKKRQADGSGRGRPTPTRRSMVSVANPMNLCQSLDNEGMVASSRKNQLGNKYRYPIIPCMSMSTAQ